VRKLDLNIYGIDDNAQAESIAADALTPVAGAAGTNISDYWGDTVDDTATAKGNTDVGEEKQVRVVILRKEQAGGGDKEALNDSTKGGQRHRKWPEQSGDLVIG
jgi:hypothetical protein